ncbi:MAG: adenylate/guanylate cyclase domain-containing protein [Spirochaetes bacterium]|uniref:adenylate cyclase n=1 Tax=Candidatus Gallitreponema excrementavium TaxID=2840840 RepID=A0A9D9HNQ5_9SPIR|nr:adenylate/guanylate cyclase domain-containing protein [Candidatus Gallitreponema excrementavium]
MPYTMEFQTTGFIILVMLTVEFFSKKRWKSLPNYIFRYILITSVLVTGCDVVSVFFIANRESFPILNMFFGKLYVVLVVLYDLLFLAHTLANTVYEGISPVKIRIKKMIFAGFALLSIAVFFIVLFFPLYFSGSARDIYSYGIPTSAAYVYTGLSIVFVLGIQLANCKKVPLRRQMPVYFFCTMEIVGALLQMFNSELLIVSFVIATTVLLMYFTLENPDMYLIAKLNEANSRIRSLLLNILPSKVADRLEDNLEESIIEKYDSISVCFMDIVDFSQMSLVIGAEKLVVLLNNLFSEIDNIVGDFRIEKIKTIGDAYMAAAGLPDRYEGHEEEIVNFARAVIKKIEEFNKRNNTNLHVRIGINTGMAVAGIIGKKKFIYDIWGESVNLAARQESYGVADKICVSESTMEILKDKYEFTDRGLIDIKGFGPTPSYILGEKKN